MATYKILGQSAPSAASEATLYTAPSSGATIGSSIVVANRSGSADTFRIRVAASGESAASDKQYLAYGVSVSANSVITMTLGVTLGSSEKVYVYSTNGTTSFNLFGQEIA